MSTATLAELESAADIVHEVFGPTSFYRWPLLCQRTGVEVWVKHENHTPTGAFKIRGGLVYMAERAARGDTQGIIAASTGNHGQSVTVAGRNFGLRVIIVVPEGNSPEKNALMRAQGAELVEHGVDFQDAFDYASERAVAEQLFMMPSFDQTLVRGVGTYGLELFRQQSDLDAVYVPIGLGSGICGVVSARNAMGSKADVVGVVASGAPAYQLSFESRQLVTTNTVDTFAAGVACRIPVQPALDTIWSNVDRIVVVHDEDIRAAIRAYFVDTHNAVEGAGACALAALISERKRMRGKRAGVIVSGGNVDREDFVDILAER